ncbi:MULTISPECIES: DUF6660 family protein [unclassified Polaribacter]|uniref:DUF6660 family protein n=1 Tax=unclassified Polaribacter TaxID=196858 RepID=UPI001408C52B|nr:MULTISPECIES: DUF6660 family protein [unclassified Polaribacter]
MKFLTFLLAIYIFALNLTPCADFVVPNDIVKTKTSQITDDHQHEGTDLCSPFCICQCCHVNATDLQVTFIKNKVSEISTQDFFFLNGSEKNYTSSILQPPIA